MKEYIQTIVNGIITWVNNLFSDLPQANWDQSDKTAKDYVKNRTHYTEVKTESIEGLNYEITVYDGYSCEQTHNANIPLALGQKWNIIRTEDGVLIYDNVEVQQAEDGTLYLGTPGVSYYPFYITANESVINFMWRDNGLQQTNVINVVGTSGSYSTSIIHHIDEKYIPDSIARTEDVMNVTNPAGTGSFSMNRLADTDIGEYSSTEGYQNTASGVYSHAEGYYTIADSEAQHVQGKFNLPDGDGVYTHIVGNGTSDGARSNAHTLDTQGNAWFAGDVYVGSTSGTNIDEGSKKIATEEQVIEAMKAFQTFIESFYTGDAIILPDTKTGKKYLIQIEDGNLVSKLTMEEVLIDFDYTKEEDGTYSLTAWKETLNGDASTELIIPDDSSITL